MRVLASAVIAVAVGVVAAATPTKAPAPSPTSSPSDCSEQLAKWKGKTVDELIKALGQPSEKKALKDGKVKLTYPVEAMKVRGSTGGPPDEQFPANRGQTESPPAPPSATDAPSGTASGSPPRGVSGKLPAGSEQVVRVLTAYVFWADADGKIYKAACNF